MPPCPFCERDLESASDLDEHMKMRIGLKCGRCGRPFVNHCALGGHLAKAHTAVQIRASESDGANSDVNMSGIEGDANPLNSNQLRFEGQIQDSDMINRVTEPTNHFGDTTALAKSEAIPSNGSGIHAEDEGFGFRDEVMVGDVALSSLDVGVTNSIACPTCNRLEESLLTLRIHQVVCEHCYCKECKAFLNDATRGEHIDIVHRFTCTKCTAVFTTPEGLQDHLVQVEHCYCKRCNCFFTNDKDTAHHSTSFHVYPCGECDGIFRYPGDLIKHQDTMNHIHLCSSCNARFGWSHELSKHEKDYHNP